MKYESDIKKYAKRVSTRFGRTYDERQDIEGRCIEAAWKAEEKIKIDVDPKNFFIRIMENTAISYLRTVKTDLPLLDEMEEFLPNDEFFAMIEAVELEQLTEKFLEALPKIDNKIVSSLINGSSLSEIAEDLGMKIEAIRTRVSRGRKKWKEIYEKEKIRA